MARVKLSEFDAKRLLYPAFSLDFAGLSLSTPLPRLPSRLPPAPWVLKVDQGVKKRGLQGLVKLSPSKNQLLPTIKTWSKKGWSQFLLEPLLKHQPEDERYLALTRTRDGWDLAYSPQGGVEIESHWDSVHTTTLTVNQIKNNQLPQFLPVMLHASCLGLISLLDRYHLAFVEINPLVIKGSSFVPLDLAAEIDSAALALADLLAEASAKAGLAPIKDRFLSPAELKVAELDAATPASLKFKLINPQGKIWMLLSGGGASLVLADEVADLGLGQELANYGEYSGAPSEDDTYAYTKTILQQMLQASGLKPKAIIIAGGVANFTDVAKTFKGIIRALGEFAPKLKAIKVKVFVRRGGPNEEEGLREMSQFLKSAGLYGSVHGSDVALTKVIREVWQYLGSPRRSDLTGLKSIRPEKQPRKVRP